MFFQDIPGVARIVGRYIATIFKDSNYIYSHGHVRELLITDKEIWYLTSPNMCNLYNSNSYCIPDVCLSQAIPNT